MRKEDVLYNLPAFENKTVLIAQNQTVNDIGRELVRASGVFQKDYNRIATSFVGATKDKTLKNLFDFLKENVRYVEENEGLQTVKSPAAILISGRGDCKHYASFIYGVCKALTIKGYRLNPVFAFAGYNKKFGGIGHVFVICRLNGREVWVDPVLDKLDQRTPKPLTLVEINNNRMLQRVSGIDWTPTDSAVSRWISQFTTNYNGQNVALKDRLLSEVKLLAAYGVIKPDFSFVTDMEFSELMQGLSDQKILDLTAAYLDVQKIVKDSRIGNIFGDIWHGIKTVGLAPFRAAFLALVGLNFRNLARKLYKAIYLPSGSIDNDSLQKVREVWVTKFDGHTNALLEAINRGKNKRPLFGGKKVGAVTVASLLAAATPIIIAITSLVNKILQQKAQSPDYGITAGDLANYESPGIVQHKDNTLLIVGLGGLALLLLTKKNKR